jgi:hypothetical protein
MTEPLNNIDITGDEYIKKLEYIVDYYRDRDSMNNNNNVRKIDEIIDKIKIKKEIDEKNSKEPILKENINRFTTFPIKYTDLWELYKTQEKASWTAEELD